MNVIFKGLFGSHLYGLDTPESDKDYKVVFIPDLDDLLLGKGLKGLNQTTGNSETKNTKEDVDVEYVSLHRFIQLACAGDSMAIDMLHTPPEITIETSDIWKELVERRKAFYTKDMKSYLGYAMHQAAKYGVKGSRLSDIERVREYLKSCDSESRLHDVWDGLPEGSHITKNKTDIPHESAYVVCGKTYLGSVRVGHLVEGFDKWIKSYGNRAQLAKENKGVDWKALSHACRVSNQIQQIFMDGDFEFPFRGSQHHILMNIKQGRIDFTEVQVLLESQIARIKELSSKSWLPETADTKYWDKWLVDVYKSFYDI